MDYTEYDEQPQMYYAPDKDAQNWAVGLHLSQYGGFFTAYLGFVAPILIWLLKKDDYPILDAHGKNVANWIISFVIYTMVFGVLSFFLIGIPFLVIVLLLGVIYPVIGAVKASQGEVWRYPLTIDFFQ